MSFYLSNKDYKEMIGIISGDTGSKKGNGESTTYLDTELTAQEPKKQQQGIVADTVDAVQMGAWKGVSDIAHGVGALTGADWLHDVGDWAAKGADENVASMSDEMKAALNQNAFDGEGQGVRNLRWWAGNLGSLIGQNLDTALTLGAGKIATIGAKQAGKLLLKKEVAEEVGKTAVEQAAKRGIPQKYWNMVGITATMSAMSGGGRYGQKRDEVMGMTNEQLAQIPQFSDEYYSIADSDEGKGKSTDELYTMAKKSFADKVGRDAALNPTAIATDLVTNAVSGLGGGFWGLGSPAKTIKGGLLKGAAVEGGTEAIQGIGEQYALNKADQDYLNPNKDLTDGMADNAINGAVLGAVFGSAMGGLDTHTDRIAFNNQKRTILNHINTGNDAVDSQLRNYVDMLNHGATELGDLVSVSRVQALNNAGIATAKARQAAEEALAEQQAKAKFESDFFGEEQSQQETTSTFKVDPNLERALELHSILGQFRKNDLSRANEFIDTPTIFADEQARKDYVIGRAFDEVRNIAQSYGIDPKDGKAMRHWLEDYAEKAKEYTSDDQQYNSSSNQQDSENLNGQPYNISKQTSEEVSSLKEPNQPIDFNLGAATKDLSIQPEVNLGYNSALARQNSNLVEFDLNQPLSNQQSAEYDGINPVGNGLLSTHMNQSQLGRQLTADSSLGDLNSIAKDINADNQIQKDSNSDFRLSLNESADSDFAKAVDTTIQGGKPSRQYIPMGTTPDALKMLGLPDTKVLVGRDVLRKVMLDKHNVTAETLKQLPKQINHPIAIMKSAPQATHDGYVVLTELLERNISTGSDEPIISALHLKNTKDGLEVINIASVYGKNLAGLQNMLNNDLAYWNKTKGSQFIESFGLQLPSKIDSKMMSQSLDNIKTEADLSQYQTSKNDQVSKFNPEVQSAQEILNQTFGKAAEHIEVTTFANPPKDVRHLITSDVEGWFNPKTGKVTLIADSINATKTMSKEERLQFVAWHEMAHRGINVGYKGSYDSLMQEVGKNKAISQIADAIQAQRKNTDDLAATNRAVAIEEAIAEMMAAHETGKWNELESRYGVEIKKGQRQSTKSWLAMTAQRIKDFLSKFFGVERAAQFSDEDVLNLIARIKSSSLNETSDIGDLRFSRNEELTEERYNQAKSNGETELTFKQWQQVRSPEFKAWFGDWENDPENASKVVNPKTGEPLVVYHGTLNSFNVFSNDRGIHFVSDDPKFVDKFVTQNGGDLADGANVMPLFISSKNPFDYTNKKQVGKLSVMAGLSSSAVSEIKKGKWQRIEDRTIIESIKDLGFDGFYVNEDGVKNLAVFNSNQIKSASSNTGGFLSENDDIRFSRKGESEYQRDLIVTHNISADGIMHADKIGGLPLASVAVAKQSNPLTNFGEVTLIGSRNYIDPKGVNKAQVFGSDIYSPRYPQVSYEYSDKDKKALFNHFEKAAKEVGDGSFDYNFTQGLEDTGAKQAMLNSDAVKYQFLKEHNIPYKKAYRDIPKSVHADYPSIQKAIKAGISEEDISSIESADKFEGLFREFIKDYIKDIEGRVSPSPSLKNVIVRAKQALDGDKYAVRTFAESRVKEGLKLQESKKVLEQPETLSNMRKAVSEHEDAFRNYVDSIVETMPVKEKIWNGTDGHGRNKYVAHTIENVVKKLKKDLRGGESFNYGMPNVRAAVTPKFKSIADIQANKHRIVSKEEFETARDALKKEGDSLANKLGVSTLDIYDVLWNAVDENTSKAFGYAGIKDTQENRMAVDAFLNKLKALPTEYFEGKAKDITQFSNFAGAVVPDNLAKNAYDVLEKSGVKIFTYDSTNPNSRIEAIKQATNQLDEERGGDILFSRANTMQSALDLAMTGVADSEPSAWDSLKSKDFSGFKERFNRAVGKVDEWLADSLRPVNDWIDSMHLEDQTGNTSSRDHEKRRLKDAMYVAKGKRDAINSELEQAYLKPILSKIAALSKQSQNKSHPMDELTMKRMVGNWISARYSIEKNIDLLNRDEKVMRDTKRLLDNAKQNGTSAEVRRLHEAYLKAKEQYDNRKADIYNTDYKNKGNRFKVGVAGGWSIPEAELIMSNTEKHISRSNLEYVADLVYDLNQSRLDVDRASGRYTEAEYQEYKANRHYVPLTGDPNADVDVDIISGAGSNALNIARDKTLKGRTSSEAEDAIDAVWKSIGKSTTYAGFAEFKARIDDLFETEVALLKDKGYSDAEAREQATANLGISKRKMQGLTRSSDNVLIRKEGSDYYEYELPTQVMESLRNDNVEHANAFLKVISKPTGWYARGVTQWTVTFAPMNMMRDTWEKSEFIRVQKLYDKNNRLVDSKTMDKIGRDTIKNAFTDKEVWQATKRLGFGQELRDSVPVERMLKQLLKEGGVSNYGTYLDKSEVDLVKRLRKENNPLAGKLEKVGKVFEGYNKMFDTVSALASYKALVENGIDSKQAAATTLELTNFRKTGSKMRGIKALYMFSQPTVMGAANLMRYLSTRKGQIRFAAYMAAMTSLYTVLRSMDDEDEGGNKMDQLGDITRYIPIPLGGGKYFKIPVGFGMAQMAWNFSTNIVKGAVGDISLTEAGANMLVHSLKTFSPVSPSEISAAKYPMEKITLTATPSILQPVMQNVLNRSAFGNKITTNYVRDDKLKAEQSKATTAQFWKDTAIELNDTLGIDMHPEQIKNLFDGYSSMLGSLKELNTIFVENPNREDLGRKTRTPFLNQFIGTTNEFAIQSRYYEASEEAKSVYNEYKSRKERNELGDWLDADKMKLIKFHEEEESIIKKARSEKANLTRALRSGKISAVAYESGIKRYNKEMSGVQARLLRKYRQMEGLNTH
ncbi:MAG: LPD38 domain-containing protein [Haemophilus parainfluenzae]|nr:LPD38 domain-containing protein [Haemophilus parainfluenzae]